jgi:hypothetical protein
MGYRARGLAILGRTDGSASEMLSERLGSDDKEKTLRSYTTKPGRKSKSKSIPLLSV